MANRCNSEKLRQLTHEQSIGRSGLRSKSASVVSRDGGDYKEDQRMELQRRARSEKATDDQAGPSGDSQSSFRCVFSQPSSADELTDVSDESSEPDSDSSDEWLPFGSARSSRASSPDAPDGHPGFALSRERAAKRGCPAWHQAGWQPNQFPFTAIPGPQRAAADLDFGLPADFLELFLTHELLQHIVDQTNLYAGQYFQAHPDSLPYSRSKAWKPVSVAELKTFFGLSFLTGYIKKPNLDMYWSVDEVDATPYFSRTMSRNRFQIIWKFLHFSNNASQDTTDKMCKVRPVLEYIVEKFKEMYQPGQKICIHEGMMQGRGHLSFREYNPQKSVKHGIKFYILCDSATGYCFNMQLYVGTLTDNTLPDTVFSLLDRLTGHGYTLYMDHFYNSVALCESLLGAQTNVCGTLRKNRGEPQIITELTKTDLGAGGKVVRHNEKVMVVAWQDKRFVTTCHQDRMQRVDLGQKRHKDRVPQFKPECVVAFNLSMKGVDKLDQNTAYYPFISRSLNWSKKFVVYLFQICMFNAYVLYKARNTGECKTLSEFMRRVVKSWTTTQHVGEQQEMVVRQQQEKVVVKQVKQQQQEEEEEEEVVVKQVKEQEEEKVVVKQEEEEEEEEEEVVVKQEQQQQEEEEEEEEEEVAGMGAVQGADLERSQRTPRAPYNTDPDSRLDGQLGKHKLIHLMPTSKKSRPARRCRVCTRRGQRRETKMWCKSCCVPLHAGECFTAYHTLQNYSVEG